MSDSYAKYIEDQQDYEVLCKKYKETVVMEKITLGEQTVMVITLINSMREL